MPSILFVCTANICRSPMASALFKRLVDNSEISQSWRVESAGTWAVDGVPASPGSVQVMSELGLDIRDHMARNITGELLSSFDLVLTMENSHKEALKAEFPEYAWKIYLLSEIGGYTYDIRDPIGSPISDYRAVARELAHLLNESFERIREIASDDHG